MHQLPQSGAQMARPSGIVLLVLLSGLLVTDSPSGRSQPVSNARALPIARVVRIPTATLSSQTKLEALSAASLIVTSGAADEPPEGPNGFDVLENGTLLITDPLRHSVSLFDTQGKFISAWRLGFPADSITVKDQSGIVIREANTGRLHLFDDKGQPQSGEQATLAPALEAKIVPRENRGTLYRPRATLLAIQFDKPNMTLISIECLLIDHQGDTYVALEATRPGDTSGAVNVSKYVRRYTGDGRLLCETGELPLSYYISPVDELRVHNGVVYQLQTTSTEVRVNVWDTNSGCSGA